MKKTVVRFIVIGIISIPMLMLSSCSEDGSFGTVNLSVAIKGSNVINKGGRTGGRTKAVIEITDFQISIRDVVFKVDDDNNNGIDDDTLDIGFRGPFLLDLLSGADALSQSIGSAEVPNGTYQELRFKFHKSEDGASSGPLNGKSILVKGTIDGTPFEMWHDTSENLDIGKSTGVVVADNSVSIEVTFSIDQFLTSEVDVDLSQAVDGNGDGLIEINPNDPDGNKDLAEQLKRNIKAAADLLDK